MDVDREMLRLWNIVVDITDQLNVNRAITERLQSHAGQLKVREVSSIWYSRRGYSSVEVWLRSRFYSTSALHALPWEFFLHGILIACFL